MAPEPLEPVAPPSPPAPPAEPAPIEPAPVELQPVTPAEPELDVAAMGPAEPEPELPAMAPSEPEQPAVIELERVKPAQPVEDELMAPDQVPAPPPPPPPAEPEIPVLVAPAPVEAPPVMESAPVELPAVEPAIDLGGVAPRPGMFRVVVRLSDGDGVEVGEFGDFGTAMAGAQEVIDQFAHANGTWPFYAGRFIRPDLIVSVDVVDGSAA